MPGISAVRLICSEALPNSTHVIAACSDMLSEVRQQMPQSASLHVAIGLHGCIPGVRVSCGCCGSVGIDSVLLLEGIIM